MAKAPPVSRLTALRQAAGLSTHALGKLAAVPQPMVWRFEHGTTPKGLVAAFKLAAALGVAPQDIWPDLPVVGKARPHPRPQRAGSGGAAGGHERPAKAAKKQGRRKT